MLGKAKQLGKWHEEQMQRRSSASLDVLRFTQGKHAIRR
jgi:hypothetical protein